MDARRLEARVLAEATARSQVATSWHPAAVATPATSAITGLGWFTIESIRRAQRSMILAK